ncbi:hypothetical protein [Streptomyces sp. NPDC058280]|uniref:hypothetical protein n=1 Tax=Streptomyces sp. NPDC058280 TaxID=3346419 RepID=UPI0036EF5969
MKVRMKVAMSGTRNGEDWPPKGELADLPTGEAQHLVAAGIAEEVTDEVPEVETAAAPPEDAETAVAPAAKRGRPRKE